MISIFWYRPNGVVFISAAAYASDSYQTWVISCWSLRPCSERQVDWIFVWNSVHRKAHSWNIFWVEWIHRLGDWYFDNFKIFLVLHEFEISSKGAYFSVCGMRNCLDKSVVNKKVEIWPERDVEFAHFQLKLKLVRRKRGGRITVAEFITQKAADRQRFMIWVPEW